MQVGTTKDQGLYNKPSAAVLPGALAAGTLPQYNTPRLPLDGFSLNLIFEYFSKICHNSILIKICQRRVFYMETYVHLRHLSEFFLE